MGNAGAILPAPVPAVSGFLRGHLMATGPDGGTVYADTGLPTVATWRLRGCGHCHRPDTPEGHDACLGTLPLVMNACCGHGSEREAYVQFWDGSRLSGASALVWFRQFGAGPGGDAHG